MKIKQPLYSQAVFPNLDNSQKHTLLAGKTLPHKNVPLDICKGWVLKLLCFDLEVQGSNIQGCTDLCVYVFIIMLFKVSDGKNS